MRAWNMYSLKIAVIVLALVSPWVMIIVEGVEPSISTYFSSSIQPLCVVVNATTSHFLFSMRRWRLPSIFLLLLTAFSVTNFPYFHNALAISFFISSAVSISRSKQLSFFFYFYIASLFLFEFGMLWVEIHCVTVISIFHLCLLVKYKKLKDPQNK